MVPSVEPTSDRPADTGVAYYFDSISIKKAAFGTKTLINLDLG